MPWTRSADDKHWVSLDAHSKFGSIGPAWGIWQKSMFAIETHCDIRVPRYCLWCTLRQKSYCILLWAGWQFNRNGFPDRFGGAANLAAWRRRQPQRRYGSRLSFHPSTSQHHSCGSAWDELDNLIVRTLPHHLFMAVTMPCHRYWAWIFINGGSARPRWACIRYGRVIGRLANDHDLCGKSQMGWIGEFHPLNLRYPLQFSTASYPL